MKVGIIDYEKKEIIIHEIISLRIGINSITKKGNAYHINDRFKKVLADTGVPVGLDIDGEIVTDMEKIKEMERFNVFLWGTEYNMWEAIRRLEDKLGENMFFTEKIENRAEVRNLYREKAEREWGR